MFDTLEIMRMAHGLARHASARQEIVARNVANADTPGYRAKDIASFGDYYQQDLAATGLRATRAGHRDAERPGEAAVRLLDAGGGTSPNGNSVSLELEMMRSAEIRHDHDMATAIYRSSLDILRASIGRR